MGALRTLVSLSVLCFLGAGYFALDLFVGEAKIGEVIVMPIYIGIALLAGAVLSGGAVLLWLWQRFK